MAKKNIRDVQLKGKKVLMRVDFNVPMKDGVITDANRIVQALPTIKYAIEQGGKVILFSHLGRVKSEEDKATNSLAPVAAKLQEMLGQTVTFIPETRGEALENAINALQEGEVLMFENTRFEDINGKKESKNDPELGQYWASLGDLFVNDAFGTAHRAHASNQGIASHIETSVSGFLLEKEIKFIGEAVDNPVRPFVAILGGAKVSDKILVVEKLLEKADKVLIGGAITCTFLKALGQPVGNSRYEADQLDFALKCVELAKEKNKLVLPIDHIVSNDFATPVATEGTEIADDYERLDIGAKTRALYDEVLQGAKTVFWNGPMGVFEVEAFAEGTKAICESLTRITREKGAFTVIGGGDSASAAAQMGYKDGFSHVSTGGGASLELIQNEGHLPGIDVIADK